MKPSALALCIAFLGAAHTTPSTVAAQSSVTDVAAEIGGHFDASARKLVALARAMPESSYGWRPMDGVASVAEVYMHIARYNLMYPHQNLGVEPPADLEGYADWEETVSDKDEVVRILAASMDHVRNVVAGMDAGALEKGTTLYGRDVAGWAVLLQLVSHMNEHLGQSIAYARTNGVAPPWSR